MEHTKYRLVMGIISIALSLIAFVTALTACILYCVFQEDYLKLLFLPLLAASSILSVLSTLFSVLNAGSKKGVVSLMINLAGIACLMIAFIQL